MLNKFRSQGFEILAINVMPEQDEIVLPFLKGNEYGFTPLKSNHKWAEDNYKVRGTPANFLVDQNGRIMFQPRVHDAESQRVLELEIEELLGREAGKGQG